MADLKHQPVRHDHAAFLARARQRKGFADAYDAMTCGRTYQHALSAQEALAEIYACQGTQFDPDIVRLFTAEVLGEVII